MQKPVQLFDIYVHYAKITCVEHAGNMYDFMWVVAFPKIVTSIIVCNQLMLYFLVMCIFPVLAKSLNIAILISCSFVFYEALNGI